MMKNQLAGLMKQAQAMQENMKQAQDAIAAMEIEGVSGAGMVKVLMTGRHDVKRVTIDPSLLLRPDVIGADPCLLDGKKVVTGLVDERVAAVGEQRRGAHRRSVELSCCGDRRADGVDVSTSRQPLARDNRLPRRRGGDDDIRAPDSGLCAPDRLHREGRLRL